MRPLAIDLFCGLGGWTEALLAEGYYVVGFDIERHVYGEHRYPGQLVIQDVLTLHGSQFRDAALIVASPPCQEYSYMAMPWSKAKAKAAEYRSGKRDVKQLTALFNACFRIQREACEAAGRHIPLIVENVRGAIPWVGRSRYNFGSFHLWGDVPALMPIAARAEAVKAPGMDWSDRDNPNNRRSFTENGGKKVPGFRFDGSGKSFQTASVGHSGVKVPGLNWSDRSRKGQAFNPAAQGRAVREGRKGAGAEWFDQNLCQLSSKSSARKAASAMIAKIPEPLARHIAVTFKPAEHRVAA